MLPSLVEVSHVLSPRVRLFLTLCAICLLGVPTFSGVAQSQETKTSTEPVPVENNTPSEEQPKTADPDQKDSAKPDSNRPKKVQDVPEPPRPEDARTKVNRQQTPEMAELVNQYNTALTQRRYGAAEEIARKAKQLEPANPTAEIMLWKVNFALGKVGGKHTANGAATNDLPARARTEQSPVAKIGPPSVEYLPRPWPEDARIVRALDARTSFDFNDVPLTEVIKQISQQHKINVVIDYAAFKTDNPPKATRVPPLKVDGISLKNALKLILDPHRLSFVIEHEVLKIVPVEAVNQQIVTRIYPVRDLVGEADDFESLMEAITQSIALDSWRAVGEGAGRIAKVPASGSLVIHHNPRVHGEVLHLLRVLREAKEISANP